LLVLLLRLRVRISKIMTLLKNMALGPGILFGIISMLAFGYTRIPQRKLVDQIGVYSALLYSYIAEIIFIIAFFLFSGAQMVTITPTTWAFVLALGITGTIAIAALYKGTKVGHVSVVSSVAQTFIIITVLLSVFFFKEMPSTLQFTGITITIIGAILVSFQYSHIQKNRPKLDKGVPYAIVTAIFWGVFYVLYKPVVDAVGPRVATLLTEGSLFLIFLLAAVVIKPAKPNKTSVKWGILTGLSIAIGAFAFNFGISVSLVSLVAPLVAAAPIVTAVLAHFILKERLELNQMAGILTTVIGIIIISLG